ncbi:Hypothetical_protein [Hexamita inflata]|uniref:Hypothetical_protein n=1 Tax=Hexamita inflata TaxID=28002 RepID=A0AA86TG72_9EUKA|nr:Hypothetical protein HINF_LOCUS4036 [Hexamita inflata]
MCEVVVEIRNGSQFIFFRSEINRYTGSICWQPTHFQTEKPGRFKSFFRYDRKPLFKLAIVLQLSSKEYIINTGFGFQNLCKKQDHSNAKTRKLYYMYFQKNSSKFQRRINSEVAKLGFINYYVFAHVPGICSDCGA